MVVQKNIVLHYRNVCFKENGTKTYDDVIHNIVYYMYRYVKSMLISHVLLVQ